MRKKILSALLCATMAVSMLAGCGDKPDSSSGDSGNDGGNSAAAADRKSTRLNSSHT